MLSEKVSLLPVSAVVRASAHALKGHWFDSQSRVRIGLQVPGPLEVCARGSQLMYLSYYVDVFLSSLSIPLFLILSLLSLPLSLKTIGKIALGINKVWVKVQGRKVSSLQLGKHCTSKLKSLFFVPWLDVQVTWDSLQVWQFSDVKITPSHVSRESQLLSLLWPGKERRTPFRNIFGK